MKIIFSFCLIILCSISVSAQTELNTLFSFHQFEKDSDTLLYRMLKPDSINEGQSYPLVIFLHGAGQRGSDNKKQLDHGVWNFALPEIREKYPAFVVAPQCPEDERWSVLNWDGEVNQTFGDSLSPSLHTTRNLLDEIIQEYPIDTSRVYITGLSMGGFGTWEFTQRFPSIITAAVPVCGGGDLTKANLISNIPIWAFHGALDNVVKPEFSRAMVDSFRELGGKPRYTEYPDVNHGSWFPAYSDLDMIDWLFRQRKW